MYFLAVFLPPLAVLLSGKPIQALLNFVLTLFFWIPGIIHAVLVVKDNKDNKRMMRQAEIIANANKQ